MTCSLATFPRLAFFLPTFFSCFAAVAQQAQPEVTFHATTNLVLVDVIALSGPTQRPDSTLQREDFRIYDNGRAIPIKTFDTGSGARPLALWFVVQCTMKNWESEGSGWFRGQVHLLDPALSDLDKADTVAVAHWCDDGQAKVDLLPTRDIDLAVTGVEQV